MTDARIVTSTAALTPDGILGYAKGIAVIVGATLTAVVDFVGEDWEYVRWLQLGILICTVIATIALPNPVKPVTVVDGAVPPPPDTITGVVQPPPPIV